MLRCFGFVCLSLFTGVLHAEFPPLFNTEPGSPQPVMSAEEAAKSFIVPEGFRVSAFAAEPDVMNPIAMAWDSRGRLWIAENYTYAERTQRFELGLKDRVVIFDNTDGEHFEKRTVFTDNVQMLTGIEVGLGGVWLMCPPKLIFIPDADRDDVPDGEGVVVLDGFTVAQQNYHNFANGLRFGPDGWLYGRCGGSCPGKIGKPATPLEDRPALEGGIWRYHPIRGDVEVLTAGTTNPWGHDWNSVGEMFFCNTVNGHLWHMIPGAHFKRPFTLDPNRRTYELIDHHADHWHFDTGKDWTKSRDGEANDFGGGHAHCGVLVYQGERWPSLYKNKLFTLNFHGRRANQEQIRDHEDGFQIGHEDDFLLAKDPWFRGMDLCEGPDENVFVIDWSDTGECHEHTGVHRESGRIYKVIADGHPANETSHDAAKKPSSKRDRDVKNWSLVELANAHIEPSRWHRRQARLELIDRVNKGEDVTAAIERLRECFLEENQDEERAVQSLLTLHVCGATDTPFLMDQLKNGSEHVPCWAIRLLSERWPIDDCYGDDWKRNNKRETLDSESLRVVDQIAQAASFNTSSHVRLTLASMLQRLPLQHRVPLAKHLVTHVSDEMHHDLPLMTWYGLMPVVDEYAKDLVTVVSASRYPKIARLVSRGIAEEIERQPDAMDELVLWIAESEDLTQSEAALVGISEGLRGWRRALKPKQWDQVAARKWPHAQPIVDELSVVFGDGRAMDELKQIALGEKKDASGVPLSFAIRLSALETLIQTKNDELKSICEQLLPDARMNVVAAKGLATFDDPNVGKVLISRYNHFRGPNRPEIVSILASRQSFAEELLRAIEKGKIPRADLSAFQVRQIQSLGDANLNAMVAEVWGEVRDTPDDKRRIIDRLKTELTEATLDRADRSHGKFLFGKHCQNCHRLFGEGGNVGPDLSGGDRSNLEYLLSNVVDPSGVVDKKFRMTVLVLGDGRVINGLVTDENSKTVTIQTATEKLVLSREAIEEQKITEKSPMPEGIFDGLNEGEIRDLIGFLSRSG